ncbi:SAM-dependent methyltransferase [Allokutzneria oryzae]|uniref:SAM-dependent methyltransferase n=1 Tax=Allokutzneria oryzae TaxID=1378989 RepID=A0ABV5ZX90_9PSEU
MLSAQDPLSSIKVDTERPNAARVYDYILGGGANFAVDRELAERVLAAMPRIGTTARMNRHLLQRAVRVMSSFGIDQFLDLGSGIPTSGNVHEVAQEINPDARVVYVDNEAVAVAHSESLLAGNPNAEIVNADASRPGDVLGHPKTQALLDFDRPVGLIMCTLLHFVGDQAEPKRVVAAYRDAMPSGSYVMISHGTLDNSPEMGDIAASYANTPYPITLRDKAQVQEFFEGFEMVEPGLVPLPLWRPEDPAHIGEEPERMGAYAGMGVKP